MVRFNLPFPSRLAAAVAVGVLVACGTSGIVPTPFANIVVHVRLAGTGAGAVESTISEVDIACAWADGTESGTCDDSFDDAGAGGAFSLIALPADGSVLTSWSGCNQVSGTLCSLTFDASGDTTFNVTATFDMAVVPFGVNLLQNPGFEDADVVVATLPSSAGRWQGDLSARTGSDQGITPRTGSWMLKFGATGLVPGVGLFTSQQWQTIDLSAFAASIDAGKVRLNAGMWVNRVSGDAETDTRFDLRVLVFPGTPAGFPADYPPAAGQIRSTTINAEAGSWQQLQVQFDVVPAGTRYVAVEIYPYEDVVDDGELPEFDGHYADDISLVLTELP